MEAVRVAVQFASMLAILFVGNRTRALQITTQKGSSQVWALAGPYMATWAVGIQFWMCLVMMSSSPKIETAEGVNVKNVVVDMALG